MPADQKHSDSRRALQLRTAFADTLLLARLYNRVIARENRLRVGIFSNAAFSLLASYVLINILQFFAHGGFALLGMLFIIFAGIGIFNEFFNLINCNFEDNIYSARTSVLFPISRPALFRRILINDLIGIRGIFYVAPSLVMLCYGLMSRPGVLAFAAAAVGLFYLAASLVYAAVDYGYGFIKYKYGRNTEKIITFTIFAFMILASVAAEYGWVTYAELNTLVRHFAGILAGKHA